MEYSQALQRLRNHANTPGSNLPEGESFLFALWEADRGTRMPEIRPLFENILACLEAINLELNGKQPSTVIEGKAVAVTRSLAADMSAILSEGWSYFILWESKQRFSEIFRSELAAILLQLGIAWDAILAGDIDDIQQQVESEFMAKGY